MQNTQEYLQTFSIYGNLDHLTEDTDRLLYLNVCRDGKKIKRDVTKRYHNEISKVFYTVLFEAILIS